MSATTSPSKDKVSWVKFDEADGGPASPDGQVKTSRSSSGVSSARGSVNSVSAVEADEGGVLAVSEVQVVDEQTLKATTTRSNQANESSSVVFKQMQTPNSSPVKRQPPGSETDMDNVNLSDENSPQKDVIRGRRFGKKIYFFKNEICVNFNFWHFLAENGEVIVTLLPVNERLPWVTPAKFRPELVPEELMAPILTVLTSEKVKLFSSNFEKLIFIQLTVEDYVQIMEKLTTDMRFTIYNICYKRILVIWIATAFIILLSLLFSGYQVTSIVFVFMTSLFPSSFYLAEY